MVRNRDEAVAQTVFVGTKGVTNGPAGGYECCVSVAIFCDVSKVVDYPLSSVRLERKDGHGNRAGSSLA